MKLESYAMQSHQGPYLNLNEDAVDVDLINNLYMLLDGFGGSGAGDFATDLVKNTIKNFFSRVGGDPDATMPFYYSHKYLLEGNALINASRKAHEVLSHENNKREMSQKGGVSAILLAESAHILTCASIGNCKGYLLRKGSLIPFLNPDNFELLQCDNFDKKFSTAPASGFGLFDDLHLAIKEVRITNGDQIVVMSDGVYTLVGDDEIKSILTSDSHSGNEKIDELFSLSNERGNLDNQSALILNY